MAIHTPSVPASDAAKPAEAPEAASTTTTTATMGHPVAHLATPAARGVMAFARITTGFVFLWAFIDKAFGFGYSTPPEGAWVRGALPMGGFLEHGVQGPLAGFFPSLNTPFLNFLFMAGMAGVGLAMMLGIGTRIAAVTGTFIMAMMWLATWPITPGSSNPVVDYHWAYATILILVALTYAGRTFGLGNWWEKLVGKQRWLV